MPSNIEMDIDKRLEKLKPGQYRIWHDGQNVLIPTGQSISKPLTKEIINVNTRVYGEIHQGFFTQPIVDFTSCNVKIERFDKYFLQTWRPNEGEFPIDKPNIDYHDDLNFRTLWLKFAFYCRSTFTDCDNVEGGFFGILPVFHLTGKEWLSDKLHFDINEYEGTEKFHLSGDFRLSLNKITGNHTETIHGYTYDTELFAQEVNLPLFMNFRNCHAHMGNTKIELIRRNTVFPLNITFHELSVIGGE